MKNDFMTKEIQKNAIFYLWKFSINIYLIFKFILRRIFFIFRLLTARMRAFPDFIIIGAQKAGTTSLYAYLKKHPKLKSSIKKEIHYFDGGINTPKDNYKKGINWYKAHFPLKLSLKKNKKAFEASPLYLFHPKVSKRIYENIPNVKIIVLLRNPTERAISHYFHEKKKNRESLEIYKAMQAEDKRLEKIILNKDYGNTDFKNFSYKQRGLYKKQLKRFYKYFSKNQILVIKSEDLFSNPQKILNLIYSFVDIPSQNIIGLKPHNIGIKKQVPKKVYDYLDDYFFKPNQDLYEFLNRDFSWEKRE